MKRVHKYEGSSGEIMFIDSIQQQIFLMLCSTVVGGLLVGIIMTYSECKKVITKSLNLFKTILKAIVFMEIHFPK